MYITLLKAEPRNVVHCPRNAASAFLKPINKQVTFTPQQL